MSTKDRLVVPKFNLLDPSREPSDEELAALMRAMQQRVSQKSAETANACREKLIDRLDIDTAVSSSTFPSVA